MAVMTNETSQSSCEDSHTFFANLNYFMETYYKMFLIIFGCMGNSMTIIVFWRIKFAHTLRISFYLICLAITDTVMLLMLLWHYLDDMDLLHDSLSIHKVSIICKGTQYLGFVINFVSCGLVLAFTMQRLCIIVFPLRIHKYTMESKSKIVVGLIVLFGLTIYSYFLTIYDVVIYEHSNSFNQTICWTKKNFEKTAEMMLIVDSGITLIFPFLALLIMNAIIIRTLKNSSYNFANRTSTNFKKISFKKPNSSNNKNNSQEMSEKKYVMCRCHPDQLMKPEEVPMGAGSDSPSNQNLDYGQKDTKVKESFSSNRKKDGTNSWSKFVCCNSTSKNRRDSVTIRLSNSSTRPKKYLVSYKLDKFNKLQKDQSHENESSQTKHTQKFPNNTSKLQSSKGIRFKFGMKYSTDDNQANVSRKSSSLPLNRGMSFRISGPGHKANTVSRKITKMLIIVSTTFLILNLPVHSFNLYIYIVMLNRKIKNYNCVENYLRVISNHLFYTSFACNFLLYSISGATFRNECKKLILKMFRVDQRVA